METPRSIAQCLNLCLPGAAREFPALGQPHRQDRASELPQIFQFCSSITMQSSNDISENLWNYIQPCRGRECRSTSNLRALKLHDFTRKTSLATRAAHQLQDGYTTSWQRARVVSCKCGCIHSYKHPKTLGFFQFSTHYLVAPPRWG